MGGTARRLLPGAIFHEGDVIEQRSAGAEILLVCRDPVSRQITLRGGEIQTALADQRAQAIFQRVLHSRVPDSGGIWLGPQIAWIAGAAERRRNQIVQFVRSRPRIAYAVAPENFLRDGSGNDGAGRLAVRRRAYRVLVRCAY